jgi:hypothetical protein
MVIQLWFASQGDAPGDEHLEASRASVRSLQALVRHFGESQTALRRLGGETLIRRPALPIDSPMLRS